jgi:hypothetical protein
MLYLNFRDTEPLTHDYLQRTCFGKKDILNLETGFITERNATWTGNSADAQYS